jgi:hypothetical protein
MTEARGRELAPMVMSGLALSTTRVSGDCRPKPPDPSAADCLSSNLDCQRLRSPLWVAALDTNQSVPLDPSCGGDFLWADAARLAVSTGTASSGGELVLAAPAGRLRVLLSADRRCATCGIVGQGQACMADVLAGHLTPLDLVVDGSTR